MWSEAAPRGAKIVMESQAGGIWLGEVVKSDGVLGTLKGDI